MKYDLEYLSVARKDIIEIAKYISSKLNNAGAAERMVTDIVEKCESLRDMPYLNPVYVPIKPLNHEYRKVRVKNYLIFYWINEAEKKVVIARVIYSKRNYDEQLADEKYEFEKDVHMKLHEATNELMAKLDKGKL